MQGLQWDIYKEVWMDTITNTWLHGLFARIREMNAYREYFTIYWFLSIAIWFFYSSNFEVE